jgi:uncharacterized membrane protein
METKELGKTSTGIQPNVAAFLSYLLGWITGLVFYLIEKENKFVRFHAFQSLVAFGALTVLLVVLGFIPVIGWALIPIVWIFELILWIVCMVKGFQGEKFKLPIAGDMAEKNA